MDETELWRERLRLRAQEAQGRRRAAAGAERDRRRRRSHGMVDRQAARLARRRRPGDRSAVGPAAAARPG
ncbi:hypothetical protein COUCH_32475 [Couchioplanes caeruleus]|uniref:hypothetical protein n=1 Tax=Couchioplanes caeruleus TaxID=56438 RepID=UPI0020BF5B29|nr:hypothetical protein [Couchioplanes caeruleus]UQU63663.1 hypothetical protein COUCH_32475 [Couchioplanes caeruleus]